MSVLHDSYVWSHPMIHVTQQKLHLLKFLTFSLLHEAVIASRAAGSRLRTIRNGLIYLKLIVTGGDDLPQIPCSSHGCGLQCRCRGHTPSVSQSINQSVENKFILAATLRWFTAGGAIRIAVRQLSQTWKLRHYGVITRKL